MHTQTTYCQRQATSQVPGVFITEDTGLHDDIRARIAKGKAGFAALHRFLKNSNINTQWKLKVFRMCFMPMLTYGMESAAIAPQDHRALLHFQAQSLRTIQRIKSTYYTEVLNPTATTFTHFQVIQQAKMPTITATIHNQVESEIPRTPNLLRTNYHSYPVPRRCLLQKLLYIGVGSLAMLIRVEGVSQGHTGWIKPPVLPGRSSLRKTFLTCTYNCDILHRTDSTGGM